MEDIEKDLIISDKKSRSDVFAGFKNLGYTYCGLLYWYGHNNYGYTGEKPKQIQNFFDTFSKMEYEIFCDKDDISYYSHWETKRFNIRLNLKYGDKEQALDLIGDLYNIEKVVKIKEDRDIYYCFWNPDKKYYYFITIRKDESYESWRWILNLWILWKRKGIDAVRQYLQDKKDEVEKQKVIDKKCNDYIRAQAQRIRKDCNAHPDNYKKISGNFALPNHVYTALCLDKIYVKPEELAKSDYFKYEVGEKHCYDDDYKVMTYINNKTLSDGYCYSHHEKYFYGDIS